MMRLFKFLIFLAIVGFIVIAGYAYIGDLSPTIETQTVPVVLDEN